MTCGADEAAVGARPAFFGGTAHPVRGGALAIDALLDGLNPEQRAAVVHEGSPLLIVAGAGSGKTRVLTHRIAHLLAAREVGPHAVLAITLPNKGAAGPAAARAPRVRTHPVASRLAARAGATHELLALTCTNTAPGETAARVAPLVGPRS